MSLVASVRASRASQPSTRTSIKYPSRKATASDHAGLAPGPYLDPPARAAVFSFDEKTSCQALDRTQPSLPLKRGRAATMTHDYKRHGTVDLFAAMNVATGQVHTHLRKGHAATDVLRVLQADRHCRV